MNVAYIETSTEFNSFLQLYNNNECMVFPIYGNDTFHTKINKITAVIFYLIHVEKYFVISFSHSDCINLSMSFLEKLHNFDKKKYIWNKKAFSHLFNCNNFIDLNLLYYIQTNKSFNIEQYKSNTYYFYYRDYDKITEINSIIPIVKHLEMIEKIINELLPYINSFINDSSFQFFNNVVLKNLALIERNGLRINPEEFFKHFSYYPVYDNLIYSEYNPYTTTGRPSNRFGGVNFSALNKNDDSRKSFISRYENGNLIEFDFQAYHLSLIANLIKYEKPIESKDMSWHEYLGRYYFDTKIKLTEEQYEESKKITFQMLYGGIPYEFHIIPFFLKVSNFINNLWGDWHKKGFIQCEISGKKILRSNFQDDINKQTLFNYLIQLTEISQSILIIDKLNKFLENNSDCKLILYTYDSLLFDIKINNDITLLLKNIKKILENDGMFSLSYKYGLNYGEMQ